MRPANSPEAVDRLEQQLMQSLRPVQPRTEFVDHLHDRLTQPSTTTLERRESMAFGLLLVAGSLLSGLFLVWLMRQFRGIAA